MYKQQYIKFLIIAFINQKVLQLLYKFTLTYLMSQKSKSIKKIEEEQSSIQQEITEIFDKKQMFDKIYYLVQFKGEDPKKQWKPETQLKKYPTFHKEYFKFKLAQQIKNKSPNNKIKQHSKLQQSREIPKEKQPQIQKNQPKKIRIDKIDRQKIKISGNLIRQQMSLDNFVGKSKNEIIEEEQKKVPFKVEQSKIMKQSRPNIKVETSIISNKQKEELLRQQMKTLNINQAPKQQVKVNPVWLQKIKSINRVKGYELKNGQMLYDVEASDKNGQNFFIPPLPSEVVQKFGAVKLAGFLQDCMLRGYAQQAKMK